MTQTAASAIPGRPLPIADLASVLAVIGAFGLSIGYSYPAIALNMEARGVSPAVIGAQAAIQGLGVLVCAGVLPWLTAKVGAWRIAVWSLLGTAAVISAFGLTQDLFVWAVLRFLLGFGANALFVICEVWINVLAPDEQRGRIVGAYTTVVAGLFALGPLLIPLLGYQGIFAFGAAAVIYLLLGLPVWRLRLSSPPVEHVPVGELPRVMLAIPVLLLSVMAFAFFDGAAFSLWVVYGLDRGLTETTTATTLSLLVVGNVVLQFPIGWLADRVNRRVLLALLAGAAFAGALMLPALPLSHPGTYVFLFFWGAAAFGVYTLAVTLIGQHLTGARLVAANSAFGVMWGIGALLGPWAAGAAMAGIGGIGLPLAVAAIYGVLTIAALSLRPIRFSLATLEELDLDG